MPEVSLPKGRTASLPEGEPVGSVLAPDAIAARWEGDLVDLSFVPDGAGHAEPVVASSTDGLHVLRHSTAHVMAQAVCDLFPGARYAIGPAIDDGFYYDFELPAPISPDDLARIEERMTAIKAADQPFVREELPRAAALERFADQPFKREIIEGLDASEGATGETVSVYRNGGWGDLCLGPQNHTMSQHGQRHLLHIVRDHEVTAPHRGERNEPHRMRHTAETLAALKGISVAELDRVTTANFHALFRP